MTARKRTLPCALMGIGRLYQLGGIGRIALPDPRTGKLALLDRRNAKRAMRRLPPECQLRGLLPYGVWGLSSGSEVLFNRHYQPVCQRSPGGAVILCRDPSEWIHFVDERWFYTDDHSEREKRRLAEAAFGLFLAGEPLPLD